MSLNVLSVFIAVFNSHHILAWNIWLNASNSFLMLTRWYSALGGGSWLPFAGLLSPSGLSQHRALLRRTAGKRTSPFPWVPCMVTQGLLRMKKLMACVLQTQSFRPLSQTGRHLIRHRFYLSLNSLWNFILLFCLRFQQGQVDTVYGQHIYSSSSFTNTQPSKSCQD